MDLRLLHPAIHPPIVLSILQRIALHTTVSAKVVLLSSLVAYVLRAREHWHGAVAVSTLWALHLTILVHGCQVCDVTKQ